MFWVIGISGLALILAPYVFGYSDVGTALWTSIILGAAILIDSGIEGFLKDENKWEYWVAGTLGILAFIAPWMFGFSDNAAALWSSLALGTIVVILSGIKLYVPVGSQS
jgi:SPW repeat